MSELPTIGDEVLIRARDKAGDVYVAVGSREVAGYWWIATYQTGGEMIRDESVLGWMPIPQIPDRMR